MLQRKKQGPVASAQRPPQEELFGKLAWDDLRVFLAVVDNGSMRQASNQLALNASTISRRLGALEAALESRLFERHPDGLKLTHAGEETLEFARRLNEDISELKRHVAGRDQELSGIVRISAAEVVGKLVCRVLPGLWAVHPQLQVELGISDAMANLERHEVDVAVRVAEEPPEQLWGSRVGRSGVGLFASQAYVKELGRDLKSGEHRWIAWPRAVEHKPAFQWIASRYADRRDVLRAGSANGVLEAVRSGVGVAALALAQASGEPALVRLELLPRSCGTAVWLLTHRGVRQAARVRAVMDYLGQALRECRGELEVA